jgi:hypothetical protein
MPQAEQEKVLDRLAQTIESVFVARLSPMTVGLVLRDAAQIGNTMGFAQHVADPAMMPLSLRTCVFTPPTIWQILH